LLNLHWPELAQVVQPLAGEWAIRRSTFAELSVPVGYGVELASLIDVYRNAGLDAIAQVDLGERAHSHQSVHDLGVMAAELLIVAERRAATSAPPPESDELWQFNRGREPAWVARPVPLAQRPPQVSIGPLGG
jgi:glucosyl-3-phosphoglycerate synthase